MRTHGRLKRRLLRLRGWWGDMREGWCGEDLRWQERWLEASWEDLRQKDA